MARDYGVSHYEEQAPSFEGDHPPIMLPVTLASSGAETDLTAGTVLGKVTASGKFVTWNHDASDGSQNAAAILVEDLTVPASGDEQATAYFHGQFRRDGLTWDPDAETADINAAVAALAPLGLYCS